MIVAIAPAGFLTLKGAGLNPFVSMPSTFGILLVLISIPGLWLVRKKSLQLVVLSIISFGCAASARNSIESHTKGNSVGHLKGGYIKILSLIESDAKKYSINNIRLATVGGGYLSSDVFSNILVFDRGFRGNDNKMSNGSISYKINSKYSFLFAAIEWQNLPGVSDYDKITFITKDAYKNVDYLIIPNTKTIQFLEKYVSHIYVNKYIQKIQNEILSSKQWIQISENIAINPQEEYIVYRNSKISK